MPGPFKFQWLSLIQSLSSLSAGRTTTVPTMPS